MNAEDLSEVAPENEVKKFVKGCLFTIFIYFLIAGMVYILFRFINWAFIQPNDIINFIQVFTETHYELISVLFVALCLTILVKIIMDYDY